MCIRTTTTTRARTGARCWMRANLRATQHEDTRLVGELPVVRIRVRI
jgi:hypothetical protein